MAVKRKNTLKEDCCRTNQDSANDIINRLVYNNNFPSTLLDMAELKYYYQHFYFRTANHISYNQYLEKLSNQSITEFKKITKTSSCRSTAECF